jgi:hypothetical protein
MRFYIISSRHQCVHDWGCVQPCIVRLQPRCSISLGCIASIAAQKGRMDNITGSAGLSRWIAQPNRCGWCNTNLLVPVAVPCVRRTVLSAASHTHELFIWWLTHTHSEVFTRNCPFGVGLGRNRSIIICFWGEIMLADRTIVANSEWRSGTLCLMISKRSCLSRSCPPSYKG